MPATIEGSSDRRILITGASGFVGGYVVSALTRHGYAPNELFVASQEESHAFDDGVTLAPFDLLDPKSAVNLIQAVRPTGVIHLAAIAAPAKARANHSLAWEANFAGAVRLAEAVLEYSQGVRFVFSGSSEVYGFSFKGTKEPLTEEVSLRPMTLYGATKACAETALLQMAHDGLDVVCFRAFNHTGPGQTQDYIVPAFASQVAKVEQGRGEAKISVGDLNVMRDFLDVRDVADAYVRALGHSTFEHEDRVMNIASGKATMISDILKMLLCEAERDIEVVVDPAKLRPNQIPYASGSFEKCARILNWRPGIGLSETVLDVLNYFRGCFGDR